MSIGELPYQLPTNRGWAFVQTVRDNLVTQPVAAGASSCEVDLDPVPAGEMWQVTRITVRCIGLPNATVIPRPLFTAYYNRIQPDQVADFTTAGAGDVAEEVSPIVLNEGDILLLVWSQAPVDTFGAANVTRQVYRKAG